MPAARPRSRMSSASPDSRRGPLRPSHSSACIAASGSLARAQVPVHRADRAGPDDDEARPRTFASHTQQAGVQIDVVEGEPQDLPATGPGIDEHADDGLVASADRRPIPLAGLKKAAELRVPENPRRFLGQTRRLPPRHGAFRDLPLLDEPAEEAPQGPIAVMGGRRRPVRQEVGDEGLDMLAANGGCRPGHALVCEEGVEAADRRRVGGEGCRTHILGREVTSPRREQGRQLGRGRMIVGASRWCRHRRSSHAGGP